MIVKYVISYRIISRIKHVLSSSCQCNINKTCSRELYHTETGVYGYRPRLLNEQYKVNEDVIKRRSEQGNLFRFIEAFRTYGHNEACLDPLGIETPLSQIELDPKQYGLNSQSSQEYDVQGLLNHPPSEKMTLLEIETFLRKVYCGSIAFEFQHLCNLEEREWFTENVERMHHIELSADEKKMILKEMIKSQVFDTFLATKFGSVKRYGGEGAETMLPFIMEIMKQSVIQNLEQIILCIAHRGRLNLLTGLLDYPPVAMFHKMKGKSELPLNANATGDVLSHLTNSVDLNISNKSLHVTMLPNPSHLEAVVPVAVGKSRGRQQSLKEGHYSNDTDRQMGEKVLCLQIHGDASFSAQGIIMETLMLSEVPNFSVGGSLHLITNNQLGFTTPADRGRSTKYSSDVVKMIGVPVIHVNGDFPEAVVKAARLASSYRQQFRRDVLVDLLCYRRWGHNELDDPTFTNPYMYQKIQSRKSIPDLYAETLIKEGIVNEAEVANITKEYTGFLNEQFSQSDAYEPVATHLQKHWKHIVQPSQNLTVWDTGVDSELLKYIGGKSVHFPDYFTVHAHLNKNFVQSRIQKLIEGKGIDWATAEAMAFGSLLYQGHNIRLSGQDVGRGTFSHRHMMLVDQKTNEIYEPLNNLVKNQMGFLEIANSPLSEEAVLGFEYGMSIENPNNLVIWEAQFGDFYNGAQIIIDTFITSGETKWLMQSGIVVLLPHGFDGAGPEHSSCHIERFLQLCDSQEDKIDGDNVNIEIVHPTTPAQYFHLLRRQLIRNFRKPLIVASPKILLRLPAATSSLSEFGPGKSFQPVLGDDEADPEKIKRILLCSGKYYYALAKHRKDLNAFDTAIVRLELLCPFPAQQLQTELKKYPSASVFHWCQEEHQNMGCWFFVRPRFENLVGKKLTYAGRRPLAATAVGIGELHKKEVEDILQQSFS